MSIKDILSGHAKEFLNINEKLYLKRLEICKECPLYSEKYGGYCDPKLWINPRTGQVSDVEMVGWVKGCGCRLMAKTRNKNKIEYFEKKIKVSNACRNCLGIN